MEAIGSGTSAATHPTHRPYCRCYEAICKPITCPICTGAATVHLRFWVVWWWCCCGRRLTDGTVGNEKKNRSSRTYEKTTFPWPVTAPCRRKGIGRIHCHSHFLIARAFFGPVRQRRVFHFGYCLPRGETRWTSRGTGGCACALARSIRIVPSLKGVYETHSSSSPIAALRRPSTVERRPATIALVNDPRGIVSRNRQLSLLSFSSRATNQSTNASTNAAVAVAGKRESVMAMKMRSGNEQSAIIRTHEQDHSIT
jgi:hypothetical protein